VKVATLAAAMAPYQPTRDPSTFPIASPWSSTELQDLVFRDVFGVDAPLPNSREAAMRLDPVARARNLFCATISRMPLRVANVDGILPPADQPTGSTAPTAPWAPGCGWSGPSTT
jgi:hypothetical protein